jgi:hypothetical protein
VHFVVPRARTIILIGVSSPHARPTLRANCPSLSRARRCALAIRRYFRSTSRRFPCTAASLRRDCASGALRHAVRRRSAVGVACSSRSMLARASLKTVWSLLSTSWRRCALLAPGGAPRPPVGAPSLGAPPCGAGASCAATSDVGATAISSPSPLARVTALTPSGAAMLAGESARCSIVAARCFRRHRATGTR